MLCSYSYYVYLLCYFLNKLMILSVVVGKRITCRGHSSIRSASQRWNWEHTVWDPSQDYFFYFSHTLVSYYASYLSSTTEGRLVASLVGSVMWIMFWLLTWLRERGGRNEFWLCGFSWLKFEREILCWAWIGGGGDEGFRCGDTSGMWEEAWPCTGSVKGYWCL